MYQALRCICSIHKQLRTPSTKLPKNHCTHLELEIFSIKKKCYVFPLLNSINANYQKKPCEFHVNTWPSLTWVQHLLQPPKRSIKDYQLEALTNSDYTSCTTSQEIKHIMILKAFLEETFTVSKLSNYQVFPPTVARILYSGKTRNVPRWMGFALDTNISVLKVY